MTGNEETKAKIEKAALDEFMEKGFANASLRQIVKMQDLPQVRFTNIFLLKRIYLLRWLNRMQIKYILFMMLLCKIFRLCRAVNSKMLWPEFQRIPSRKCSTIFTNITIILNCCFVRLTARSLLLLYIILLKEKRSQPLNLLKICEKRNGNSAAWQGLYSYGVERYVFGNVWNCGSRYEKERCDWACQKAENVLYRRLGKTFRYIILKSV